MSTLSDIIIRIKSVFERKGAEEATQATDALGTSADDAGKKGAASMSSMGNATTLATGSVNGMTSAVIRLLSQVKALGMSFMQLTLVAGVITSLIKLFQTLAERADAVAANLRNIQTGNVENAIARITKGYEELIGALDRARASRDAMHDLDIKELQATHHLTNAQADLAKQRELAAAKTDDERAAIEGRYKTAKLERDLQHDINAGNISRQLMLDKAHEADADVTAGQAHRSDLIEQLRRRQAQVAYATGRASELAAGRSHVGHTVYGLGADLRRSQRFQDEANTGRETVTKIIAAIEKLDQDILARQEAADIYRRQADISTITDTTTATTAQADLTAAATEERMRQEREASRAERARLQAEIDAAQDRLRAQEQSRAETQRRLDARSTAESREASAYTATAAAKRGQPGYGDANRAAAKENQEAQRAATAAAEYAAETNRIIKQLEAALKSQRDALKRLPN